MRRECIGLSAAALLAVAPARAQVGFGQDISRYRSLYGDPVEVALEDLVSESSSYQDRAVRTRGRLDFSNAQRGRSYSLRSTFGQYVGLYPVSEIGGAFEQDAPRMLGQIVEVTGVFRASSNQSSGPATFAIEFWAFLGPDERDDKKPIKARSVTLEDLVTQSGKREGETVRVVGKFRGRNLYGDLPAKSAVSSADWVIKDDLYAVWVTGKKPKGSGWALDPGLRRDTGKWIEVVGRVETRGPITYIQAKTVALTEPPKPTADAQPPPPKERPKLPPSLVFSLPLDGEREVPRDSRFVVQFSKDMDEGSFPGHVGLRYVGPRRPGDRDFDGVKISYDGGLRALTVDPGDLLRPGRELELVLLPGILDVDGLELVPRAGAAHDGLVDVLRYRVVP